MINTIIICILTLIIIGYYLITKQENFDPSLIPISSIVTLAKVAQKIVDNNGTLINPGNLNVTFNIITNILYQLNNRNAPNNNINISLQFDHDISNNNILSIWFNNTSSNLSQFSFKYDGGLYLGNKSNTTNIGTGAFLSSYKHTDGLFYNGQLIINNTANSSSSGTLRVNQLGLPNLPCTIITNNLNATGNGYTERVWSILSTNNILPNTGNLIQINKTNTPDTSVITFDTSKGSINTNGIIKCNTIMSLPPSFTPNPNACTPITDPPSICTTINTIPGAYIICFKGGFVSINGTLVQSGDVFAVPIFSSQTFNSMNSFGTVIVAPKYKLLVTGVTMGPYGPSGIHPYTIDNTNGTTMLHSRDGCCTIFGANLYYNGNLI